MAPIFSSLSSITKQFSSISDVGYSITSGTKAPIFGAGGGTYPPSGWSGLLNSNIDDANLSVPLPFTWTINNTGYTSIFVGSNTYITFGSGSSEYSGLSQSIPALNKIHLGAADNSYQRVSSLSVNTSSQSYLRVRYEGNGTTSGTPGSPGIVYEATFFNPSFFGGKNVVEVLVGNHNRTTGQFGVASTSAYYASGTITANQSYVFEGNSTGTSWIINTGFKVNRTNY